MNVDVEVICIGNELLIGKIENTNAYWLAKQITTLGANLRRVTVIQDLTDEIATCILEVVARKPSFIITTGGLGPTFDDKTFQGIAKALNRKLEINQKALEMVKQKCEEYFKKRGVPTEIEMTPPRVKMAVFPSNTQLVINPIGTAPALREDLEGTILFALPGVPVEVEAIFTQTITPLIKEAVGANVFCERSILTDNIVESNLAPLIDKVMNDNVGVYVKSHPMRSHVELHLTLVACQNQNPAGVLLKAAKQLTDLIEAKGGRVRS